MKQTLIILITFLAIATSPADAADCRSHAKLSHAFTEESPIGVASRILRERIDEETNGELCIDVFGDGQLYRWGNESIEAVQMGVLELAIVPSISLINYAESYKVLERPFLFSSHSHVLNYLNSRNFRDALEELSDEYGIRALGHIVSGMRQIVSNRIINHPSDMAGLEIAFSSPADEEMLKSLGASPVKMLLSEGGFGLQYGKIGGQIASFAQVIAGTEFRGNLTKTNHLPIVYDIIVGARFLDSLPEEMRSEFEELLVDMVDEANNLYADLESDSSEKFIEGGGNIIILSDSEYDAWVDAMVSSWGGEDSGLDANLIDGVLNAENPCPKPKESKCPTPSGHDSPY